MVQQYGGRDSKKNSSSNGYALLEQEASQQRTEDAASASSPSEQQQQQEQQAEVADDDGPRAPSLFEIDQYSSFSRSYVPFSSISSASNKPLSSSSRPASSPSSSMSPSSTSPSLSASATGAVEPNWMSMVSSELDQDAEKASLIEQCGLFDNSCHRCTPHRIRWLYHWISGCDATVQEQNDRIRFLKNCLEDTQNFQPFTLRDGAEECVTKQQNRIVIRLSGTVPGSIAVTWWDTVRRSPFNKRFRVIQSGLLTDGRNTVSNLSQLCQRLPGLLPNVVLEQRLRPRPLHVAGYIPC